MEDEIRNMRKDLAKFADWAKQSHEFNQRHLSSINENFNFLLKLFVLQNDQAGALENVLCTSMTSKGGIEVEGERIFPSISYEAVNDFSDDEDVEESLKIKPISLETLSFLGNVKKSTVPKIERKQLLCRSKKRKKLNFVTDAKLITHETDEKLSNKTVDKLTNENLTTEAIQEIINTKSAIISEGRRCAPPIFSGKKFEQNLRVLKRKHDDVCKRYPNLLKMPDSYLEYGAARGWELKKIRFKFKKKQKSIGRMHRIQAINVMRNSSAGIKEEDIDKHLIAVQRFTPVLNLTCEQFVANLNALREAHKKSKNRRPIPDFYFQFGAARGWGLPQVLDKYRSRHVLKSKCDKK